MAEEKSPLIPLTEQMTAWSTGEPDLQITPDGKSRYLAAISTLRDTITRLKGELGPLNICWDAGGYPIGQKVASGHVADAETLGTTFDEYLAYLTAFEKTLTDSVRVIEATDGG